jgi:subtilase family serine protease
MNITSVRFGNLLTVFLLTLTVALTAMPMPCLSAPGPTLVPLQDHIPQKAIQNAKGLGQLPADTTVTLVFTLPLRNQQELGDLITRMYDPADSLYGHYLTGQEFTERFGPTQADYDAVKAYATELGMKIVGTHPNRLLLDVSGPAGTINSGFGIHLLQYQTPDGRTFHAPDRDPEVPAAIASRISAILGLDNAAVWHAHSHFVPAADLPQAAPYQLGTGPGGGLTPNDIKKAYNLAGVSSDGSGQILGLFELDGYRASDVDAYTSYFNLPAVPLHNVLVDGYSGRAGTGAAEVTLDIELQIALAPGASAIRVYEGPNSAAGVVDTYNTIATDNVAKQISSSWGLSEGSSNAALLNAENSIFMQMAAQGQSIYAASGDSGAYDDGSKLSVDDPASQPYMVGVGGTQLFVGSNESYDHETTWNVNGTPSGGAGGGGISSVWKIPSYQQNVASALFSPYASNTMRNVPDISLNADQYTGYAIYYNRNWYIFGGTSCASPLWAAFTALVNQVLSANGNPLLGFANPAIYAIAQGSSYTQDFHDIADGSTNLYYPAGTGYDDATGWGTFNGANLLADLAGSGSVATIPDPPSGLTATAGDGTVALSWTASSVAASYNIYRGTTSGGEGGTPLVSGITGTTYTDASVTNGTTYYYEVSATNSSGTSGLSGEVSATPAAASLAITGGPSARVSKNSTTISWTTNLPSSSLVSFGISPGALDQVASSGALVTSHSVSLTSLSRHTVYYYQVSSTAGSTTVSSAVASFKTH